MKPHQQIVQVDVKRRRLFRCAGQVVEFHQAQFRAKALDFGELFRARQRVQLVVQFNVLDTHVDLV